MGVFVEFPLTKVKCCGVSFQKPHNQNGVGAERAGVGKRFGCNLGR